MAELKQFYSYRPQFICTIAIYKNLHADLFKGRLILKKYFTDDKKLIPDIEKTERFFLDTLFFETNKIIRMRNKEPYDERRELLMRKFDLLGEPYYLLYNLYANPAPIGSDNGLQFLYDKDPNAKGLALILKKDINGTVMGLTEAEAKHIIYIIEHTGVA